MHTRRFVAVLLAVTVSCAVWSAAPASAQQSRCIEKLTDDEVEGRYRMIYRSFEEQETYSRLWYFGWLSIFTGLAAGNAVFAGIDFQGDRPRYLVSMIGSALSLLSFTIFPRTGLKSAFGAKRLRRHPADTPAERRERLRYAEELLESSAMRQKLGNSFLSHAQGFAWGLGTSLLLGLRYDDTVGALSLAFASPTVNELRAITSPTDSVAAWENYRSAAKHCMAPPLRRYPQPESPTLDVRAGLGSVALTLRWY